MLAALERLARTCLLPGFDGAEAPPGWLRRQLAAGLGGVVLYARNVQSPARLAALTAALRQAAAAGAGGGPPLIAIDEEGGDVTRLEAAAGSSYPGNLALGAVDDVALTRRAGAAIGADLAAAGINLNLAPVADVNSNPRNPVIGVRSFGSDPHRVAAHTVAMVEGLQGAGVAACVKHFPGHGDTAVDSHLGLPVVGDDAAALAAGALVPFRAAIEAGVRCVMTAHLRVPAYGEELATVNRRVLTGLLREELGFEGLVITDGLDMRGLTATVGFEEGAVRALAAGADAICVGGGPTDEATVVLLVEALTIAVREGRLPEGRLAEAAARVEKLQALLGGPPEFSLASPAGGASPSSTGPAVGLLAARRALRAEGPVRVGPGALVIEATPDVSMAVGDVPWGLGAALARLDPRAVLVRCAPPVTAPPLDHAEAAGRPVVLVVRDLHRHQWQQDLAKMLLAARPDTVVVEMGWPGERPEGAAGWVRTYGAGAVNGIAATEALLGYGFDEASPMEGR
jgi:beta-N-acetylhexosaminidase